MLILIVCIENLEWDNGQFRRITTLKLRAHSGQTIRFGRNYTICPNHTLFLGEASWFRSKLAKYHLRDRFALLGQKNPKHFDQNKTFQANCKPCMGVFVKFLEKLQQVGPLFAPFGAQLLPNLGPSLISKRHRMHHIVIHEEQQHQIYQSHPCGAISVFKQCIICLYIIRSTSFCPHD